MIWVGGRVCHHVADARDGLFVEIGAWDKTAMFHGK